MAGRDPARPAVLGLAVLFLTTGVLLLAQQALGIEVAWSTVLPIVIAAVGFVVLLTGLHAAHRAEDHDDRSRRTPR